MSILLSASLFLTGTYAWQSIRQKVNNELLLNDQPGARLHDDFNGSNKDVYVENYIADGSGTTVYVRVRLSEYLEKGADAGKKKESSHRNVTSLYSGADINDTSTWNIHIPQEEIQEDCGAKPNFHDYFTWELGGETVFMPTFNKDNTNNDADINGTWSYINQSGNADPYGDYDEYELGDSETGNATYAPDSSVGSVVEETHEAKKTQDATVMTMKQWIDAGSEPGKYWVWDTDGWAYWAEALQPGEATGCLLTGIQSTGKDTMHLYYAIDVVGEFASAGDWGQCGPDENGMGEGATGFYENGLTTEAYSLLNKIAGVTSMFDDIETGSTDTVTIDGIEFYVLVKNYDETLLYAKEPIANAIYGSSATSTRYKDCLFLQYMDPWLDDKKTLTEYVKTSKIYARVYHTNYENYDELSCKVFLLSEADLFGTANGNTNNINDSNRDKEFTFKKQLTNNTEIIGFKNTTYGTSAWLRSPHSYSGYGGGFVAAASSAGAKIASNPAYSGAVRPALWVKGL